MAAHDNIIDRAATVEALNEEFIANFRGEYDRLVEILGLFQIETRAAGSALYQYEVTGKLLDGTTKDGSSGTEYVEGDFIARSKYEVKPIPIGETNFFPYAKETTAQAILKGGFENSILKTDRKALQQLRADTLKDFYTNLDNGTGKAAPDSGEWGLQELLAYADANLEDALEDNGDQGGAVVHFVNRQDAAKYLAGAPITTQTAFGLTYLEDFLGVENVLLTNAVKKGSIYATPVENIHIYGIDYATLSATGLDYETDELGLVGVKHAPTYDYASVVTYFVRSMTMLPEIKDYIVKGSMTPTA